MSLVLLIEWVTEVLFFDVIEEGVPVLVLMLDVDVLLDIGGLMDMELGGLLDMGGLDVVGGLLGVVCLISLGDLAKLGGLKGAFGVVVFGEGELWYLGSQYSKAPSRYLAF